MLHSHSKGAAWGPAVGAAATEEAPSEEVLTAAAVSARPRTSGPEAAIHHCSTRLRRAVPMDRR